MKTLSRIFSNGLELSLFGFSFMLMSGCMSGGGSVSRVIEDFAQTGLCILSVLLVAKLLMKRWNKHVAARSSAFKIQ